MARAIRWLGRRAAPGSTRRAREAGPQALRELIEQLPEDLRAKALTHSSWVEHRADSYGRLAFLGDSVLGLAVAEHLYHRYPRADIGRLTKVHGQAVSGRACAAVAHELGLADQLREREPRVSEGGISVSALLSSERALASICEAVIGSCYLHHGFAPTVEATVAAFASQIEIASQELLDFKSALQEFLARQGVRVRYEVTSEAGPPHDRRFEVAAMVERDVVGTGTGRSKKAAEQAAAARAMDQLAG